jgi:hypothetical protein
MKLLTTLFLSLLCFAKINAQTTSDDSQRIVINPFIPSQVEGLPPQARNMLENKMKQMLTKNGFGGTAAKPRFIITPNIVILTKDITPTAPPMHAFNMEVTFYVGDGIQGTLFSSTSVQLKGVGENEAKAYISAFKNIKEQNPQFDELLSSAKNKIIEYYKGNCDFILKSAQTSAQNREFDKAINELTDVPNVVTECYNKSMDLAVSTYKSKIEFECQQNISEAKAAIAQNRWDEAATYLCNYTPDMSCYKEAMSILTQIGDHRCSENLGMAKAAWSSLNYDEASKYLAYVSSDSKCAKEAEDLGKEILKRAKEVDKREWSYKLKTQENNFELKSKAISALRDVGVAYGKNQPRTIYKTYGWW